MAGPNRSNVLPTATPHMTMYQQLLENWITRMLMVCIELIMILDNALSDNSNCDSRFPSIVQLNTGEIDDIVFPLTLLQMHAEALLEFYDCLWDGSRLRVEPLTRRLRSIWRCITRTWVRETLFHLVSVHLWKPLLESRPIICLSGMSRSILWRCWAQLLPATSVQNILQRCWAQNMGRI